MRPGGCLLETSVRGDTTPPDRVRRITASAGRVALQTENALWKTALLIISLNPYFQQETDMMDDYCDVVKVEIIQHAMNFHRQGDWVTLPHNRKPFQVISDCWSVEWVVAEMPDGEAPQAVHYKQMFLDEGKAQEVFAHLLLGIVPEYKGDNVNFKEGD